MAGQSTNAQEVEDVSPLLGKPHIEHKLWYYDNVARNPDSGQSLIMTQIEIVDGVVRSVSF